MYGLDHFTHLAPFYDKAIPFISIESLRTHGMFSGQELVLDAGGGTGRVALAMTPFVGRVVVADLSSGMLAQAKYKGLIALKSPVELLPFRNGTFDRVVMIDALHHLIDQKNAADEMWRILAPGGLIVIQEPDIRKFSIKLVALAEKIALMRSHFLSSAEISDLFRSYRCDILQTDEDNSAWVIIKKLI
jgi:ubiquinone/menaquinone biosynthesis C-methylase UbiE